MADYVHSGVARKNAWVSSLLCELIRKRCLCGIGDLHFGARNSKFFGLVWINRELRCIGLQTLRAATGCVVGSDDAID